MRRGRFLLAVVLSLLVSGCGEEVIAPPDGPIGEFIAGQRLDRLRDYDVLLRVSHENVTVFAVRFGEPQDCPSGCFYHRGVGLQYRDRIGWIELGDVYSAADSARYDFFDVWATDTYLFSEDFLVRLRQDASVSAQLRLRLATDVDTPREGLLRIARTLADQGWPYLGWRLLEHPTVATDREILTVLSSLSGQHYQTVRDEALRLLQALGQMVHGR